MFSTIVPSDTVGAEADYIETPVEHYEAVPFQPAPTSGVAEELSSAEKSEEHRTTDSAEANVQSVQQTPGGTAPIVTRAVDPIVTEPETTPQVIIATVHATKAVHDIELYNQTDGPVDIASLYVMVGREGGEPCRVSFIEPGWVMGRSFLSARSSDANDANHTMLSDDCSGDAMVTRIELYQGNTRIQLIEGIAVNDAKPWLRHKSTVSNCNDKAIPSSLKQTGSAANDYVACPTPLVQCGGPGGQCLRLRTSDLYQVPETTMGLRIIEVMSDSRSCAPDDKSYDCYDFVKVKNTGATTVNLSEYRLRSGAATSSSTVSNTFHWQQPTLHPLRDEYALEPGGIFTLTKRDNNEWLNITSGEGTVWIEDYYGIRSYQSVSYNDMDLAAASGKSWAYDERNDAWGFGVPSPYGDNVMYMQSETPGKGAAGSPAVADCGEGRERNPATNRCRNIPSANIMAPCKEGQYRSEETNRCRSIASVAAAELKPCADNQFRNPLTNRCKTIASSDDLSDCGEGRERNPATNRCRNVHGTSSVPASAFAVQPVKEGAAAFIGWWALGGVGLLAVGYGAWEWRKEITAAIMNATRFFSGRK